MSRDKHESNAAKRISESAIGAEAVVVDTPLARPSRALWIGTGGDITVTMENGSTVELKSVPAGSLLPISVRSVDAAVGADDMVAFF